MRTGKDILCLPVIVACREFCQKSHLWFHEELSVPVLIIIQLYKWVTAVMNLTFLIQNPTKMVKFTTNIKENFCSVFFAQIFNSFFVNIAKKEHRVLLGIK